MIKYICLISISIVTITCGRETGKVIEVYGRGEVKAKPDYVDVSFSIANVNINPETSQKINMQKSSSIIQALIQTSLKKENIFTTNYNLSPEYQYINQSQTFIGYKSVNSLMVRIENLDQYSTILTKILSLGVNEIESIRFGVKNYNELKLKSMNVAVENARIKAQNLASPLNCGIGKAIKIVEINEKLPDQILSRNQERKSENYGLMDLSENKEVISKGERYVTTDVLVIFAIK
ncbi:MAG: SIMPL domain-containing protein [Spirochaetia bacterium]|nr:SIMPL domain-containing protein [Spirochaetia bacterium]